jgi:hypothetical protein
MDCGFCGVNIRNVKVNIGWSFATNWKYMYALEICNVKIRREGNYGLEILQDKNERVNMILGYCK